MLAKKDFLTWFLMRWHLAAHIMVCYKKILQIAWKWLKCRSICVFPNDTPHLVLVGKPWNLFCEYCREKYLCYKKVWLYIDTPYVVKHLTALATILFIQLIIQPYNKEPINIPCYFWWSHLTRPVSVSFLHRGMMFLMGLIFKMVVRCIENVFYR